MNKMIEKSILNTKRADIEKPFGSVEPVKEHVKIADLPQQMINSDSGIMYEDFRQRTIQQQTARIYPKAQQGRIITPATVNSFVNSGQKQVKNPYYVQAQYHDLRIEMFNALIKIGFSTTKAFSAVNDEDYDVNK